MKSTQAKSGTRRVRFSIAKVPYVTAAAAILIGLLVLTGWQFGIEGFKRVVPDYVAMNPATAIGFILAGSALAMEAAFTTWSARRLWAVRVVAGLVCAIGAVKLMACAGGPDLRIDQMLYAGKLDTSGPAGTGLANRMAPNTAMLFVLIGAALLGLRATRPAMRVGTRVIGLLSALIATVAIVGYFNGVISLYKPTALIPIAVHTATTFLLMAGGILALDYRRSTATEAAGSGLQRKISLGFTAALFLLGIVGMVSYASIRNSSQAGESHERASRALIAVSDLMAMLAESESAMREYVISGDESHIAKFHDGAAQMTQRLESLERLVANTPEQAALVRQLRPLLAGRTAELHSVEKLRRKAGRETAERVMLASALSGEETHTALAALRDIESTRLDARRGETAYSNRITTVVIVAGMVLAFVLVGVSGWVIRRDLAERSKLDCALRAAQTAAEAANESKSRFLANMSHEIRTPMGAIIGYTDLLLDPAHTQSDRLDYVNTIRRNGEHLLTIINDVLDISKIEAGKFKISSEECCPCAILSDVASLMRVRAVEKLIRLDVKNEGLVPAKVKTDPARLRQILINLVGNAIKFTDEGWVKLIMRIEDSPAGKAMLRFDIMDTGIGMSREQVSQLFQPFVQVDDSSTRRFGGTGLGLNISRRLAEMLGGSIEVDSSPGRGSTFTVRIDPGPLEGVPRVKNCREALAGVMSTAREETHSIILRGRILLVDDGQDNRRLLSVYLRGAGADVTLAENGKIGCDEALAAVAHGEPFDVILMDMQMPELDGYGAASRLRSKKYTGPIVALTANAMADDREKCINAGCTDYLSKPVKKEVLLAMVAKYMPQSMTKDTKQVPAEGIVHERIRSELDDETLRGFLEMYIDELPGKVAALEHCAANADMAELKKIAHNLRGTGGMYGFMPITEAATTVETLLKENGEIDKIREEVTALVDVIRRIEGFGRTKPAAKPTENPTP